MAYTEEELALLSQEERDAIAADQFDPDKLAAIAGNDGEDGDVQGDEGAAPAASVEEGGAGGEAGNSEASASEEPLDSRPDFMPKYHAPAVEDYETKLADLDTKFESGDLPLKDYNRQRDELVRLQTKAEISAEQNAQMEEQLWWRDVSDFINDHPEYKESKFRHAVLDLAVKDLATQEMDAGRMRSNNWFLREAHKTVQEEFGGGAQQKPDYGDKQPEGKKPPDSSRKPDLSVVPKTLSHLPAAELPETGSVDEFAHLDRLAGLELEAAVARLSPAERERYRTAA